MAGTTLQTNPYDLNKLLDRLTHHCEIFEMNSESFRFRESMKENKRTRKQS